MYIIEFQDNFDPFKLTNRYKEKIQIVTSIDGRIVVLYYKNNFENVIQIESSINEDNKICDKINDIYYSGKDGLLFITGGIQGLKILQFHYEYLESLESEDFQEFYEYYIQNKEKILQEKEEGEEVMRYEIQYKNYEKAQKNVLSLVFEDDDQDYFEPNLGAISIYFSGNYDYLFCTHLQGFYLYNLTESKKEPKFIRNISNIVYKYEEENVGDIQNLRLLGVSNFQNSYGINKILLHPNQNLVFIMTEWSILGVLNFEIFLDGEYFEINEGILESIFDSEISSQKSDMVISPSGDHLFVTFMGFGVVIYDISQINDIKMNQVLDTSGILTHIQLISYFGDGDGEQTYYIMTANSYSLDIYYIQQGLRGINKVPNLFTFYQSESIEIQSSELWPWEQETFNNNQYLFTGWASDGIRVHDISKLPYISEIVHYKSSGDQYIPDLGFISYIIKSKYNENVLIMGGESTLWAVDFSDIFAPIVLFKQETEISYIASFRKLDQIENHDILIVGGGERIFFYNLDDLTNLKLINDPNKRDFDSENIKHSVAFENFIYSCDHIEGKLIIFQYIYDESMDEIELTYQGKLSVPSLVIIKKSNIRNNIIYGGSLFHGVYIINVEDKLKPFILNQINVKGSIWQIDFNLAETQLFASTQTRSQLCTVNISNLQDIKLQNIQFPDKSNSIQVKYISEDQDQNPFLILLNYNQLRVYPLFNSVKYNVEVYQFDSQENQIIYNQDKNSYIQKFYVGVEYLVKFAIIENPLQIYMYNIVQYDFDNPEAYLEQNYGNVGRNSIQFTADKDMIGIQTLVQRIHLKIYENEFQDINTGVTEEISKQLYNRGIKMGYIDVLGFPTFKYSIAGISILLDDLQEYEQQFSNLIRKKIQFAPFIYQVI
ncbi:WD40-repeat-containing domain [Pseudocohnilembus persalinus]|uniref:WD40-repeat-containing domain n=1 Tax=Pseudocohnilembus persalinus TaxID=266149 RepID=A0A0V0QAT7_PSEPJ|nr:WD40-repeat-containing domain [Pseudocohnilembus persalinus]|eukprot:KRW99331.1 WD40-repeat-containing domain [Pseudocohnilembus persalinus]